MKICNKNSKEVKGLVRGNLYQTPPNDFIFMYTGKNRGVCLNTGHPDVDMFPINYWIDVTDKYCLQEI